MDYADSTGALAGWETPFPAQVQPGWVRREGAVCPDPSQGPIDRATTVYTCCELAIGILNCLRRFRNSSKLGV